MQQYSHLLQTIYFGNSVQAWLTALGVFIGAFVVLRILLGIVIRRLLALTKRTAFRYDESVVRLLKGISSFFYFAVALLVAARALTIPAIAGQVIYGIFVLSAVFESVRILQKIILFFVEKIWLKDAVDRENTLHILGLLIKVALWSVGLLLILSNLGFDITTLIASLGIGGVAIALAVQSILSDLFNSLSIYVDKPFTVGDFIIVGDHMGTVQKIGLKTTRIQALQGEEIVISNSELTSSRVRNFKQMQKRRIVFHFGVTYDTSPEMLRKIPGIVQGIIDPIENAEFGRAHFQNFGDSSLNFEVVYHVLTGDYGEYMDIQQAINVGIHEACATEKVEMAFPTRTVHLVKS